MQSLTFLAKKGRTWADQLSRFLSLGLRRAYTLFLVINLVAGTTLLLAGDAAKSGRNLRFGQIYGSAVFLSLNSSGTTTDAPNSVPSFTTKDGRRSLVLTDKVGDYIALLEPGRSCVSAYTRKSEPISLGDKQLKCVDVTVSKDTRLDVMLVRSKP
jgi:hypothetical protein